jgi:hypothetical protein
MGFLGDINLNYLVQYLGEDQVNILNEALRYHCPGKWTALHIATFVHSIQNHVIWLEPIPMSKKWSWYKKKRNRRWCDRISGKDLDHFLKAVSNPDIRVRRISLDGLKIEGAFYNRQAVLRNPHLRSYFVFPVHSEDDLANWVAQIASFGTLAKLEIGVCRKDGFTELCLCNVTDPDELDDETFLEYLEAEYSWNGHPMFDSLQDVLHHNRESLKENH